MFLVCYGLGSLNAENLIIEIQTAIGRTSVVHLHPRATWQQRLQLRSGSWVQKWPGWQAKSKRGRGPPGKSFQPCLNLSRFMKLSRKMIKESAAGAAGLGSEEVAKEIPKASKLPKDHMQKVGTIDLQQLAKYSCSNDRMLVSCHGDIFDVSSRPDIYGWGPKSWQAGKDITWSVVTGNEKPDQCNRFYDVFKLDPEHISRYLTLICQRLVTLQDEFGKPVGRLDKFLNERYLPAAPQAEIEECKQQWVYVSHDHLLPSRCRLCHGICLSAPSHLWRMQFEIEQITVPFLAWDYQQTRKIRKLEWRGCVFLQSYFNLKVEQLCPASPPCGAFRKANILLSYYCRNAKGSARCQYVYITSSNTKLDVISGGSDDE